MKQVTGKEVTMSADSSSGRVTERKGRSFFVNLIVRLIKEKPLGAIAGGVTLLMFLVAIFAGSIAPYGMNETRVAPTFGPPSVDHILGGDQLGRDLFSRVIYGARISVTVGLGATLISIITSLIVGGLSGYIGGKLDLMVQRFVDALQCFPSIVVLILLMSLVGPGLWTALIVLGLHRGISGSRVIRSAVISEKERLHVRAAAAIGCSYIRIYIRHIVPNIMAIVLVLMATRVPSLVLAEASLSFLGFGVPPPFPSWGGMLSGTARNYVLMAPHLAIWPGVALCILVFSANMFGDALRDLLDPRLRGGVGRYGTKVKKDEKGDIVIVK